MFRLRVEADFDASHVIPGHPGKCRNLHGHFYKVELFVAGTELDSNGILKGADFLDLKDALRNIVGQFDHRHLNDILGANTAAENIAKTIYDTVAKHGIQTLEKVRVWESPRNYAEYWR